MTDTPDGGDPVTWFDVARAVSDRLVPERADWVVVHVRTSVVALMRSGFQGSLEDAGIGAPSAGEALTLIALRHGDADLEVALHRLVLAMAPRVGDPYGSGRVTGTGLSRLASQVDPAHLRAIATDAENLEQLRALDLGGAVISPVVTQSGVVIGAINLVHSRGKGVAADDLAVTEEFGRRIGARLDSVRAGTAGLLRREQQVVPHAEWLPPEEGNPVAEARAWVRRTLPEHVDRTVRPDLVDDLDLVVSELAGNALRHGDRLRSLRLHRQDQRIRLAVSDGDDREPTRRVTDPESEGGRGLFLVDALVESWGVDHDLERGGKTVWADLAI